MRSLPFIGTSVKLSERLWISRSVWEPEWIPAILTGASETFGSVCEMSVPKKYSGKKRSLQSAQTGSGCPNIRNMPNWRCFRGLQFKYEFQTIICHITIISSRTRTKQKKAHFNSWPKKSACKKCLFFIGCISGYGALNLDQIVAFGS